MTDIVNDEILLEVAKEELEKYLTSYNQDGLVLGDTYKDKITAIYELLVKIYGKPYLEKQGIKMGLQE